MRHILVTFAGDVDDAALERAIDLAVQHRARLTVAVPVG